MRSAFFVVDLVARNADPKTKGRTRGFIHLKFVEPQAVGLVLKEKG
jgi:hypothetical protein